MSPDAFIRIQLGRVWGEPFQMHFAFSVRGEVLLDDLRPVDWSAVPDNDGLPTDLPSKVLEEPHAVRARERMILHRRVQLTGWSDPADHRNVLAGETGSKY